MKRISILVCALSLLAGRAVWADAPDELYVRIYNIILAADGLREAGQGKPALERYLVANAELAKLKSAYKEWNPKIVDFRQKYLADRIAGLAVQFPGTTAPAPIIPPNQLEEPGSDLTGVDRQIRQLQNDLVRVRTERTALEEKLKEALAARPKDVDPAEMAKAHDRSRLSQREADLKQIEIENQLKQLAALKRERDDLQKRIASDKAEAPVLRKENATLKSKVADLNKATADGPKLDELNKQLAAIKAELKAEQARAEALARQNRKMETLLTDPSNPVGVPPEKHKELERERDALQKQINDLQKQIKASPKTSAARKSTPAPTAAFVPAPSAPAKVAVVAEFTPAPPLAPASPAPPAVSQPVPFSSLTAGLANEAQHAYAARRYEEAESKYQQMASLDQNSVFVLANLAASQLEQNKLAEAERNLRRAVSLDPQDAFSQSLLGLLKFRQSEFEEAHTALDRAARLDPSNPQTQNYLGLVLDRKSRPMESEAAFRRAVQIAPDYAIAHFNLAVFYSTQKPAANAMADWHYRRALVIGHPKSPELERLLAAR